MKAALAGLVLAAALGAGVATASAGTDATSFGQAFSFTGAEQSLEIPEGVEMIHLVGGGGASGGAGAPNGGSVSLAPAGTAPSITISYTAPGTTAEGPHGRIETNGKRGRVRFELTSSDPPGEFECGIDGHAAKPCESPFKRRLRLGRHKLTFAAVDPDSGNSDPTPAKASVRVVRVG